MKALWGIVDTLKGLDRRGLFRSFAEKSEWLSFKINLYKFF